MATALADVLPELLELDKAGLDHGDLSALDGLLTDECLGLVDEACALTGVVTAEETPVAPSTPPKATHVVAFPDSSPSASPPNELVDAFDDSRHSAADGLLGARVAAQLAEHAAAAPPAHSGSVSSAMDTTYDAPSDGAACSRQETQEYLLVRLDESGRVLRQATHADMVLLSDLLQQPRPCESAELPIAPSCTRKPGGPCCHCGVTESPQWRRGPPSKPVLCNACGTRYRRTSQLSPAAGGVTKVKGRSAAQRKRASAAPQSLEGCTEAPAKA